MTPAEEAPAVEIRDLVLDIERHRVLDGISLEVAVGEKVVLIGPSGSGKSSLLRCMNGLERPSSGTVRIFGDDLWANRQTRRAARRRIGTIFQHFNLFAMRTALDNVALGPVETGGASWSEARALARALLRRVGVAEHADKFPFQLSGGQQQRVAIARALATRPRLLLLDEPTSALDPELVQGVLELVATVVAESGMTAVCVTHEIGFARRLADRVVLLGGGRVEAEGRPSELLGGALRASGRGHSPL